MSLLRRLFGRSNSVSESGVSPLAEAEFKAGDRVRDAFGAPGTVADVDPQAEHGMGLVTVKMDDGREIKLSLMASGLDRI